MDKSDAVQHAQEDEIVTATLSKDKADANVKNVEAEIHGQMEDKKAHSNERMEDLKRSKKISQQKGRGRHGGQTEGRDSSLAGQK